MESQADDYVYIRVDGQSQQFNYVSTVPKEGTSDKATCAREVHTHPILSEIHKMAAENEEVDELLLSLANELISTRTIAHDHYIISKAAVEKLKNIEVNRDHRSSPPCLPPRIQIQPQAHALYQRSQAEVRQSHVQQQSYTNGTHIQPQAHALHQVSQAGARQSHVRQQSYANGPQIQPQAQAIPQGSQAGARQSHVRQQSYANGTQIQPQAHALPQGSQAEAQQSHVQQQSSTNRTQIQLQAHALHQGSQAEARQSHVRQQSYTNRPQIQLQAHALHQGSQAEAQRLRVQQQSYTSGRGNAACYRADATNSQHAAEPSSALSNSGAQDPRFWSVAPRQNGTAWN